MGIATDMKNLGEEIIASYDMRMKWEEDRLKEFNSWWTDIQKEVHDLLKKFGQEHTAMADELKKALAQGETERLKEFKPWWSAIQKEVHELLQEFQAEREKMASNWQKFTKTMESKRAGKMPQMKVEAGEQVRTVKQATAGKGKTKKKSAKKAKAKKMSAKKSKSSRQKVAVGV
ncbi:hypothetical protein KA005_20400 [bacterium]|nr:hypothetical protein [bacterium]